MRWDRHTWFSGVAHPGMVLFGFLILFAWAQTESAPSAHSVPPSDRPSLVLILDDAVAEIPVSEAVILLLSTLGSGLLLGGMRPWTCGANAMSDKGASPC